MSSQTAAVSAKAMESLRRVNEPISIRNVTIKNRIARSGHTTAYGIKGQISDDLIAYHVERAKGGVGLSCLDLVSVHPSSLTNGLFSWDDSVIEGYRRITDAVRPYGMKMFHQVWHGGSVWPSADGSPPWSASALPNPFGGIVPVAMNHEQIDIITQAFARAAWRAREGGLDGIEVHTGHGYLLQQFFSPMTNRRSDEYGGSFENRTRFMVEVLRAIRVAVGEDFPIGIRMSDDLAPNGLTAEECARAVAMLEAQGLIDFINGSQGSYHSLAATLPAMDAPTGCMLPSSSHIVGAAKNIVRIVTGRFRTLEEVEQLLREGTADMVGMVRAHIADPDIVKKTFAGKADQVRPCIGCNEGCVAGFFEGRVACVVNPAAGFELALAEDKIARASPPKHVVVVGGGPGGMEAARTAALSGHRVTLLEASPKLGGALNIARLAPKLQGIYDIADWLEREIYRLGVDVRTSTYAEADDVLALKPDVVLVATGSTPSQRDNLIALPGLKVEGLDQAHVITSAELIMGERKHLGNSALVFDDTGQYEAVAAAEFLLEKGLKVTYATRFAQFAPSVEMAARAEPALTRLYARGEFRVLTRTQIEAIGTDFVRVRPIHGSVTEQIAADTVVMVAYKAPLNDLVQDLAGSGVNVKAIGDALSPRTLRFAMREGHMAGRQIA